LEHKKFAVSSGFSEDSVLLCKNGDRLILQDQMIHKIQPIQIAPVYMNMFASCEISLKTQKERRVIAKQGVIVIVGIVENGKLQAPPIITSQGIPHDEEFIRDYSSILQTSFNNTFQAHSYHQNEAEFFLKRNLRRFLKDYWGVKPKIISIINELEELK
jgi:mRNA degradation ribonuclease J1/J2